MIGLNALIEEGFVMNIRIATFTILICILLTLHGCNNQKINDAIYVFQSENETEISYENSKNFIIETPENSHMIEEDKGSYIDMHEFLMDPYGYADDEYISFVKNTPIDIIVNERIYNASYQELEETIQNGISIWKEETEYAINELFKDISDQALKDKLLENQATWEKFVQEEINFDKNLTYSHDLGGYTVDFGIMYRYMLLYRYRALHIKYLHYMLECTIEDRTTSDFLSMKFKNA